MRKWIPILTTLIFVFAAAGWRSASIWKAAASEPASVGSIPGFPCYRTLAELEEALLQTASDHPQLAQLETIGSSYEGRPLHVIRLTNTAIPGPKPILFLLANTHSREVITSEMALGFIDYLTDLHGIDADATWLLDQHDIRVLVSANPDGHFKVDQGEAYSWWQKNTHPNDACTPIDQYSYPGVDLDHNFNFHWLSGGYPCGQTYKGYCDDEYVVISEPETLAVQNYFTDIFDDSVIVKSILNITNRIT
jgi:murein tripeptide amidase MpaA